MSTMQSPVIEGQTCLSEDIVLAFQRGETTESERQRVHRHIDACDNCRKLLFAAVAMAGSGSGSAPRIELDSVDRLAAVMGSGMRLTAFAEGKRLARRFDVTRFVDRGGMGEVYEAFDNVVGARVALKALLCTASEDDAGASRLGVEVKLARRIAHPNVCRIYDMHEHREGDREPLRFLAMEFVDGVTLKEHLLAGELAIEEACSIARQLLIGLDAVHSAGVLHLDFKSQNVMLRQGKSPAQAVVMDFSLSRAFEKELRLRTSERRVAGSIGYMSPEQLECRSTIGPAADVYAFGVVFYEMLTGQMPFRGDSPAAIMFKQLKSRVVPPSQLRPALSPALDAFVVACLSRHARSRFQTVASAIEAFERCTQPAPERRRNRRALLRTAGIAVLAAAGAGTLVHLASRMTAAEASTGGDTAASEHVFRQPPPPAVGQGGPPDRSPTAPLHPEPSPSTEAARLAMPSDGAAQGERVGSGASVARRSGARPSSAHRPTAPASRGSPARQGDAVDGVSGTGRVTLRQPPVAVANRQPQDPRGPSLARPEARPLEEAPASAAGSTRPASDSAHQDEWVPVSAPDFLL